MSVAVPEPYMEADPGTGAGRVWTEVLGKLRERGVDVRPRRTAARREHLVSAGRRGLDRRRRLSPDVWLTPGSKGALAVSEPVVTVVHGAAWPIEEAFFEHVPRAYAEPMIAATQATVASATIVIAPSQYTRRGLIAGCGVSDRDVHVVPHGVDIDAFNPSSRGGRELVAQAVGRPLPYVLFASVPSNRQKNLSVLRDAMSALAARGYPHALVIAGGNGLESAEEVASIVSQPPGMAERVAWLGHVDDAQLSALMAGCDAFCLPSLFESFGLTALEAMACGAPVIVANRGALPEVVGDAALAVEPTVPSMTSALERVLGDPSYAAKLRAAGRARAERMTWAHTADGWLRALSEATKRR